MASSYKWSDALGVVSPYIKSIPTSSVDAVVCDQLNSFIWKSYPWRWAQFSLTSSTQQLSLVNNVQDYAIGTTTAGGFYQLLRVRITRTDTTPNIVREKDIINWLSPNLEVVGAVDTIEAVCFEPVNSQIRLDRAASVPSGTAYQIDGEYWAQPVKITLTSSVIVFPDQYFDVAVEGLKWKYYQLGDDKREPSQRAIFAGLLNQMKDDEDFGNGPGQRFPSEGLGVRANMVGPGLFGYYLLLFAILPRLWHYL